MKVAIIGAGSTVFMRNIVRDLLQQPALTSTHIALQDIDSKRLQESQLVARQIISALKVPATVSASLDRREVLQGANVVITMFQVGGYKPSTVVDFDIPKKYGFEYSHYLILHGRYKCIARKQKCDLCEIKEYCKYYEINMKKNKEKK